MIKPHKEHRKTTDRRIGPRRKTWLVEDWRSCYRWLSVQAATGMAGMVILYEMLPTFQSYINPKVFNWLMLAGLVSVVLARVKNQGVKK